MKRIEDKDLIFGRGRYMGEYFKGYTYDEVQNMSIEELSKVYRFEELKSILMFDKECQRKRFSSYGREGDFTSELLGAGSLLTTGTLWGTLFSFGQDLTADETIIAKAGLSFLTVVGAMLLFRPVTRIKNRLYFKKCDDSAQIIERKLTILYNLKVLKDPNFLKEEHKQRDEYLSHMPKDVASDDEHGNIFM